MIVAGLILTGLEWNQLNKKPGRYSCWRPGRNTPSIKQHKISVRITGKKEILFFCFTV
jgi:hypothetical protein